MTDARHTGYWGQTGTGKSHEVKRRLASHARVVVIDVNDEFSESSTRRRGPLREAMTVLDLKTHPRKLFESNLSLALVGLDPLRPQTAATAVKLVARLQAQYAEHYGQTPPRLLLVLDECGGYARFCEAVLASLATTGGQHLAVTVWCIAQRPVLVPKTVRSQMKELVLFHMDEPADLDAVEERTHSPGLSQQIIALPDEFTPGRKPFLTWSAGQAAQLPPPTSPTREPQQKEVPP